jgi:PKHD-type hydroxylase
MLLKIEALLNAAELARIRQALAGVQFDDGRATAGAAVRDVKKNLQAAGQDKQLDEPRQIITAALLRSEAFSQHALPRRFLPPMFNRYDAGMEYGSHVDNAVMGSGEPLRADLSVTVFLNEPADYDGGALVIDSDGPAHSVKLAAGSAVVYESTTIHRVEPVVRGSRLAAVTWVQSFVRESAQREMIQSLMELGRWARNVAPGSAEAMKIAKLRSNLMRMWAEL